MGQVVRTSVVALMPPLAPLVPRNLSLVVIWPDSVLKFGPARRAMVPMSIRWSLIGTPMVMAFFKVLLEPLSIGVVRVDAVNAPPVVAELAPTLVIRPMRAVAGATLVTSCADGAWILANYCVWCPYAAATKNAKTRYRAKTAIMALLAIVRSSRNLRIILSPRKRAKVESAGRRASSDSHEYVLAYLHIGSTPTSSFSIVFKNDGKRWAEHCPSTTAHRKSTSYLLADGVLATVGGSGDYESPEIKTTHRKPSYSLSNKSLPMRRRPPFLVISTNDFQRVRLTVTR